MYDQESVMSLKQEGPGTVMPELLFQFKFILIFRYVTRCTGRKQLLADRAKQLSVERAQAVTTDDDDNASGTGSFLILEAS